MVSTGGFRLFLHGRSHLERVVLVQFLSSKTGIKSSLGLVSASPSSDPVRIPSPPSAGGFSLVSNQSPPPQSVITPTSTSSALTIRRQQPRKRKEILRMEESELEGYDCFLKRKPPLLERRGEATSHYLRAWKDPTKRNYIDAFSFFHGDWDLRSKVVKRWWTSLDTEVEIKGQAYNPKRNKVLGNDLAVAHFIVFRKGKVRFRDHDDWITEYRKDARPGVDELDLPVMRNNLCSLPTMFDPRFRVEAIDCEGLPLMYEGLANFQNLSYVKWLSFKKTRFIDDWCLDRIARIFHETLEYIDLSGCQRVSERGVGALIKCKNLKTLIVGEMPNAKHLEMVTAMMEDQMPELTVFGVDYEAKMNQIRIAGENIEKRLLEAKEALEANTITIEEFNSSSSPVAHLQPVQNDYEDAATTPSKGR